ncbi:hypothetical protein D3C74_379510 [compost metagenome]
MDAADIHRTYLHNGGFPVCSGNISNEPFIAAQHTLHMSHAEFVDGIGPAADVVALNPASGKRRVNPVIIRRA